MNYTVDSSFILACLFKQSDPARNKLQDIVGNKHVLYSHSLLYLEVAEILTKQKIPPQIRDTIFKNLKELPIQIWTLAEAEYDQIFLYSTEYKCPVYNFSYHYIAKLTETTLLTANKKYFDKTKSFGNIELV